MHERLIAYLDPSDDTVTKIEELEVDLEVSQIGDFDRKPEFADQIIQQFHRLSTLDKARTSCSITTVALDLNTSRTSLLSLSQNHALRKSRTLPFFRTSSVLFVFRCSTLVRSLSRLIHAM